MKEKVKAVILALSIGLGAFMLPSMGFAQSQQQAATAGILFGLSVPDADNTNPYQLFGVIGTANISSAVSFGGYYIVPTVEKGDGGRKFEYSLHGIELAYHFSSNSGDTFIGLRTGLSKIKTQESGVDLIFSPYHYGFASGHNYYLANWLSLGFEGAFIRFQGDTTRQSGTIYEEDTSNIISFLASIKLMF